GPLPFLILRRVKDFDSPGDHSDRPSGEGAVVRGAVDAPGEAGDDHQVLLAEVVGEAASEAARGRRSVARSDNGNGLAIEQSEVPLGSEKRRRILQFSQQPRVESLPEHEPLRANLLRPRYLL